jgi:hypothetical protein
MTVPFTIDGSDIPVDAPKLDMTDAKASQISRSAETSARWRCTATAI